MIQTITKCFGSCKYPNSCNCQTKEFYEVSDNLTFYVFDEHKNEDPVFIQVPGKPFQLTVQNPSQKSIVLIKLDNCLFTDEIKKCDCLVTDNDSNYFVEIKTSAAGGRNNKRKIAMKQLAITIQLFETSGVALKRKNTSAVICFKSDEPRIINSSRDSARAAFLEKTGFMLQEKNVILF